MYKVHCINENLLFVCAYEIHSCILSIDFSHLYRKKPVKTTLNTPNFLFQYFHARQFFTPSHVYVGGDYL